jgi:hypothetical protein
MIPQNSDNHLIRASEAINEAMKKVNKDRLKAIVDEVKAMHIPGPTLEEYFENFETQFPSSNVSKVNEEEALKNEFVPIFEWSPAFGYNLFQEPYTIIGGGTIHTGEFLSAFHTFERINIASAQIISNNLISGVEWSQLFENHYTFTERTMNSFFGSFIKYKPPPSILIDAAPCTPLDDENLTTGLLPVVFYFRFVTNFFRWPAIHPLVLLITNL